MKLADGTSSPQPDSDAGLEEADHLASEVVVIDHGRVVATGTPDELKSRTGGQVLEVAPADLGQLPAVAEMLARYAGAEPTAEPRTGRVSAPVADAAALPDIVRRLYDAGIVLTEFTLRKTSLDEVFLTLTGHQADDEPARPAGEEPAREEPAREEPARETERIPA